LNFQKAIDILTLEISCDFDGNEQDRQDAIKLGIEALKAIKQDKVLKLSWRLNPLPGETEE